MFMKCETLNKDGSDNFCRSMNMIVYGNYKMDHISFQSAITKERRNGIDRRYI